MSNWYKKANMNKEKEDFFNERTKKHVERVQNAAKRIVEKHPEYKKLLEQVKDHDKSKFEDPERTPYIELTWRLKESTKEKPTKEENEATLHHVKNNRHHPEYFNKDKATISTEDRDKSDSCMSAYDMDDISLCEMIADWHAVSEELGTKGARAWYDKQNNVRWKWNDEQNELIDKLLRVFE